ncbi:hypothetical protein IT415_00695 [bacterium]|nr:hypothetical protein [bacterium]
MSEREPRGKEQSERNSTQRNELKDIAKQSQQEKLAADAGTESKRQQAIDKAREQLKATEKQAEKSQETKAEVQAVKSEKKVEKAETVEKPEPKTEKQAEKSQETKAAQSTGRRARKQAYDHTMEQVRSQLTPSQQVFSRFVHSRPIEYTSELLEETFYRPSFLLGGTLGALIFGGALYISARVFGFELSGSEFTLGIIGGGLAGFVCEKLYRFIRKDKSPLDV